MLKNRLLTISLAVLATLIVMAPAIAEGGHYHCVVEINNVQNHQQEITVEKGSDGTERITIPADGYVMVTAYDFHKGETYTAVPARADGQGKIWFRPALCRRKGVPFGYAHLTVTGGPRIYDNNAACPK